MNLRLILPVLAGILVAASCTPYVEPPPEAPIDPAQRRVTTEEEKEKIREQREAMKKEREGAELPEKEKTSESGEVAKKESGSTSPGGGPTPPDRQGEVPVAKPVPGKPGFVFSPFNNKIIDVKGFPPGTLVADPTYPTSEKKRFRVP